GAAGLAGAVPGQRVLGAGVRGPGRRQDVEADPRHRPGLRGVPGGDDGRLRRALAVAAQGRRWRWAGLSRPRRDAACPATLAPIAADMKKGGRQAALLRFLRGCRQFGSDRSSSSALRKRAASPPVAARWSKVSEIGIRRCTSMPPITATTSWLSLPAPTIATHGGTTTGVAQRPAHMPKLDRLMV